MKAEEYLTNYHDIRVTADTGVVFVGKGTVSLEHVCASKNGMQRRPVTLRLYKPTAFSEGAVKCEACNTLFIQRDTA